MNIALDYDNTFTASPMFWTEFIYRTWEYYQGRVKIYLVTSRHHELDTIKEIPIASGELWGVQDIIYCNGVAKRHYTEHFAGVKIDVWIDDKPESILENSTATIEWLREWRATRKND